VEASVTGLVDGRQPVADWPDPLTAHQLAEKLRALADVALGDFRHDFGTLFETYSSRARIAGEAPLSLAECQQILRSVRDSIPKAGRWRSDLMVLNRYLYDQRKGLGIEAAHEVLPRLLRGAADFVNALPHDSVQEGGHEHV
jgi:hypothetical protein